MKDKNITTPAPEITEDWVQKLYFRSVDDDGNLFNVKEFTKAILSAIAEQIHGKEVADILAEAKDLCWQSWNMWYPHDKGDFNPNFEAWWEGKQLQLRDKRDKYLAQAYALLTSKNNQLAAKEKEVERLKELLKVKPKHVGRHTTKD